jgi:hypothetical protein
MISGNITDDFKYTYELPLSPPPQIVEDVPLVLSSLGDISAADFDVDERIDSAFSRRNWTYRMLNQQNLNQVQLDLRVTYGYLSLEDATTSVRVVAFGDALVLVIAAVYGHDVCRLSSTLYDSVQLTAIGGMPLPAYSALCYPSEECAKLPCPCMLQDECQFNQGPRITLYLQTNRSGLVRGVDITQWQAALTLLVENTDRCSALST